jgi:hypothetical protein
MAKIGARPAPLLLSAARRHETALQAAGLAAEAVQEYESALRRLDAQGAAVPPAAQVLLRDLHGEVEEFQAAIRKEFPGNAAFQGIFAADQPIPAEPAALLALGQRVAKEAPEYAPNLIKYAINAATVKHLRVLCDQLERELREAPAQQARALEQQIAAAAHRAFAGKPELRQFEPS